MMVFSLTLTNLSILYVVLGFSVIRRDRKSRLNRLFFALNFALIIWSITSSFYISAPNREACIVWNKLSVIGGVFFIGILLHFFLAYTHKEALLRKWWIYIVLYLPSVIFSCVEITADFYTTANAPGSNGWIITANTDSIWPWALIGYDAIIVIICMLLSRRLMQTTTSQRERKQAGVLFIASAASLGAGLAITVVGSLLELNIPDITPMAGVIWSIGIFYAINQYKLMAMTPSFIADSLFQTINDAIILADANRLILSINPEAERLLGYNREELAGGDLNRLFAQGNLSESAHISELLHACPIQNMESFLLSKAGVQIPIILSVSECKDKYDTLIGYILASKDITEYKRREEEIRYLSYHDQLTGLYNRRFYEEELKRLDTKRNLPMAIIMGDVNGLKMINDSLGHDKGDELLTKVAQTMKDGCRSDDIVARLGGDEFVVLMPQTNAEQVEQIIKRIHELLTREKIDTLDITVAFGYEVKTTEDEALHDIVKAAEDHMYQYKLLNSENSRKNTIDLIMNALYEKNNREMLHSKRVGELCEAIAMKMNFEKETVYHIKIAGLMHDIGKIGIDDKTLNKPGKLNDEEWDAIKQHPEIGKRILSAVNEFADIGDFIFEHQEKWDGTGYPRGLKGSQILLQARIIAVADAYDAMTSHRSYGRELSEDEAITEIERCSGTQFDPDIARIFVEKVLGKKWD
jgi:diguanylate cyclase (GGDEF)-like protein/PAS domain S-box-containing protein